MFGEFSSKFAEACAAAPAPRRPGRHRSRPRHAPDAAAPRPASTSTPSPTTRRRPAWRWSCAGRPATDGALVAVDATSGAGGLPWDPAEVDVYYFAPQKCFAADGGLWLAACSPAAVERIERIAASDRWRPASLDLGIALDNSRLDQTYNTPALATLFLLDDAAAAGCSSHGGLDWCAKRSQASSAPPLRLGRGARVGHAVRGRPGQALGRRRHDRPRRRRRRRRGVSAVLRANGIVDTDSYRKLGRNQLRIGMFPAIEPADVEALTACIDHVVEHHG